MKKTRPHTHPEINEYRRRSLMEATIRSLVLHGAAKTSVRTISALSEGSRSLVAHYYAGKEGLLIESFAYLLNKTRAAIEVAQAKPGITARDRLKVRAEAVFSPPIFALESRLAFLAFWDCARYSEPLRDVHRQYYKEYRKSLRKEFSDAAVAVPMEIDADEAAVGLMAIIDGLWLELSLDEDMVSRRRAMTLCNRYIDLRLSPGA
jgi:TetR/AcrR family transcriptional repressor of bet genes